MKITIKFLKNLLMFVNQKKVNTKKILKYVVILKIGVDIDNVLSNFDEVLKDQYLKHKKKVIKLIATKDYK